MSERRARLRDYALVVLMVVIGLAFAVGAVRVLLDIANNRTALRALWLPIGLVCSGALCLMVWRRTVWGRQPSE